MSQFIVNLYMWLSLTSKIVKVVMYIFRQLQVSKPGFLSTARIYTMCMMAPKYYAQIYIYLIKMKYILLLVQICFVKTIVKFQKHIILFENKRVTLVMEDYKIYFLTVSSGAALTLSRHKPELAFATRIITQRVKRL